MEIVQTMTKIILVNSIINKLLNPRDLLNDFEMFSYIFDGIKNYKAFSVQVF